MYAPRQHFTLKAFCSSVSSKQSPLADEKVLAEWARRAEVVTRCVSLNMASFGFGGWNTIPRSHGDS